MAKGNCEFRGSGGQYFVTVIIHLFLISLITFCIYSPWAFVRLLKLKASHTFMNNKAVSFTGTGGQLFVIIIVHFILLTGITLGLYTPWALCKFYSWRAQNTLVGGKPSQFIGTGGALFLFFLIHLLLLPLLTLGLYYLYGVYRLYAWREEHTKYGGDRTSFGAGFVGFLGVFIISSILNTITFSLFTPWAICMFYKWQIGGLSVGLGEGVRHFPPVKANPILVVLLIILGILPFAAAYYLYWPLIKNQAGPFMKNMGNFSQLIKTLPGGIEQKIPSNKSVKRRIGATRRAKHRVVETAHKRPTPSAPAKDAPLSQSTTQAAKTEEDLLKYDREIKELDDLIIRDRKNAKAFYSRGWLYAAKGDLQKAVADYTRAVGLDDKFGEAYYNRGIAYVKMNKYALAIKDFTTVIQLDGRAVDAYCNRGSANFELGKTALALNDYNQALKIRSNDAEVLYNRGVLYLSQKKKEKAMADFEKASKLGNKIAGQYLKEQADLAKKPEEIPKTSSSIAWKMDLSGVTIPGTIPSGRINGDTFVSASAKIDHGILTIRDGKGFHPDHAVMIFLFLKKGETAEGKSFNITKTSGFGSPHVHMKWKPKGSNVPKTKMFMKDYVMRLKFGFIKNGKMPGKIYLCIPDKAKSYVAGSFRAVVKK